MNTANNPRNHTGTTAGNDADGNGAGTAAGTGTLPAAGGLRPQVMVTIDYRDLLDRLEQPHSPRSRYPPPDRTPTGSGGTDSGGAANSKTPSGQHGHETSSTTTAGIPGTG